MGCAGSQYEEPEPEDEDVAAVEEKIEEATQYYEEKIEPLRAELVKLKHADEVSFADTINKRSPPQLGGMGSASRKPVDDASRKIEDTQREIQRLQQSMRAEIADLREQQREVIDRKERIKCGELTAAPALAKGPASGATVSTSSRL
jgi:phage host-nuclease inhibitor protein Gam